MDDAPKPPPRVEVRITIGPDWFLYALLGILGALGILGWLILTT